jgi:hypothetical protein
VHEVIGEAFVVIRIIPVIGKPIAVVTAYAAICGKPDVTAVILGYAVYPVGGKPLINGIPFEPKRYFRLDLCKTSQLKQKKYKQKNKQSH